MKRFRIVSVLLAAVLLTVGCVNNQLDDTPFAQRTLNLIESKPYIDDEFIKKANSLCTQTNLFKGNNFNPLAGRTCGSSMFELTPPPFSNELISLTEQGVALGRALFYDPLLSVNNRVSCGSCHIQSNGFAENRATSAGVVGVKTDRNAMGLTNIGLDHGFFWRNDERSLQEQILGPVQTHIEMGMNDLKSLEQKLAATDYYPALFEAAFGDPAITTDRISHALTQFVARIISTKPTINTDNLSPTEQHGRAVFSSNCATCHIGSISNESSGFYDIDRPDLPKVSNIGLDKVDKFPARAGGFKIPSLHNIALTAPYMHDGRFKTLEEVVEHYNSGIQDNPNLDRRLRTTSGAPVRMNMTPFDKVALVAFLKSLTDMDLVNDERFSDPFK